MSATSYKLTGHAILRILKKYTDEDHHLRQKEIIKRCIERFALSSKTLWSGKISSLFKR